MFVDEQLVCNPDGVYNRNSSNPTALSRGQMWFLYNNLFYLLYFIVSRNLSKNNPNHIFKSLRKTERMLYHSYIFQSETTAS